MKWRLDDDILHYDIQNDKNKIIEILIIEIKKTEY